MYTHSFSILRSLVVVTSSYICTDQACPPRFRFLALTRPYGRPAIGLVEYSCVINKVKDLDLIVLRRIGDTTET